MFLTSCVFNRYTMITFGNVNSGNCCTNVLLTSYIFIRYWMIIFKQNVLPKIHISILRLIFKGNISVVKKKLCWTKAQNIILLIINWSVKLKNVHQIICNSRYGYRTLCVIFGYGYFLVSCSWVWIWLNLRRGFYWFWKHWIRIYSRLIFVKWQIFFL